jgi:hypothetical protein
VEVIYSLELLNRVFASLLIYGFYIFSWKFIEKPSQIQNFRILEPLVSFKFNFIIWNLGVKTFKKLSLHIKSLERELFPKFLTLNYRLLKILDLRSFFNVLLKNIYQYLKGRKSSTSVIKSFPQQNTQHTQKQPNNRIQTVPIKKTSRPIYPKNEYYGKAIAIY